MPSRRDPLWAVHDVRRGVPERSGAQHRPQPAPPRRAQTSTLAEPQHARVSDDLHATARSAVRQAHGQAAHRGQAGRPREDGPRVRAPPAVRGSAGALEPARPHRRASSCGASRAVQLPCGWSCRRRCSRARSDRSGVRIEPSSASTEPQQTRSRRRRHVWVACPYAGALARDHRLAVERRRP